MKGDDVSGECSNVKYKHAGKSSLGPKRSRQEDVGRVTHRQE